MQPIYPPRITTQLRIPADLHAAVAAIAKVSNRSTNAQYLELIAQAVKAAEKAGEL